MHNMWCISLVHKQINFVFVIGNIDSKYRRTVADRRTARDGERALFPVIAYATVGGAALRSQIESIYVMC